MIFILFLCSRNSGAGTPQFQALAGTQYSKNQEHRSFMAIIEKNNKTRKLEIRIITVKAFIRIIITALIQSFLQFA